MDEIIKDNSREKKIVSQEDLQEKTISNNNLSNNDSEKFDSNQINIKENINEPSKDFVPVERNIGENSTQNSISSQNESNTQNIGSDDQKNIDQTTQVNISNQDNPDDKNIQIDSNNQKNQIDSDVVLNKDNSNKKNVEENILDSSQKPGSVNFDFSRTSIDPSVRVPTGINGFDDLIQGGFEKNSIVLVVGSAGTGKTLLGLQFLHEGVEKYKDNSVFISFEESKESIYKHSLQFGWNFEKLERENKFRMLFFKPHQVVKILEEGGGQIRDALTEINAKRVVVDSITAYALLFNDEYKRREKVLEFFSLLGRWNITSIVIAEDSPNTVENKEGSIAFISDAVISMYYHHDEEKGLRIHSLEVLKMRGTKHTNKLCAINFEDDGINVYPDVEVF
jgi:circadian clock protein KaiC